MSALEALASADDVIARVKARLLADGVLTPELEAEHADSVAMINNAQALCDDWEWHVLKRKRSARKRRPTLTERLMTSPTGTAA